MQFTVQDQKPATLNPLRTIPIRGDYDPMPQLRQCLVDPVFEPLPGRAVSITDDQNTTHDADSITELWQLALSDTVNHDAQTGIKSLLAQTLISYDAGTGLLAGEAFAIQAAASRKLPTPSPRVLYSAGSDVIPAAKGLLSNPDTDTEAEFFAATAYTYSPETLGFWFHTDSAFADFQVWFDQQVSTLAPVLPPETVNLLGKFKKLTLTSLTESLILRKDDNDELQEYSFARILIHLLTQYAIQQANHNAAGSATLDAGMMPFSVSELFLPRTVVLVNVERHARTTSRKVDAEWKLINASLGMPVKALSKSALAKLTALPRAMAKAANRAATAKSNKMAQLGRSARVKLRRQAPSSVDILTGLSRVMKKMKEVNRSQNIFKKTKTSFVKANRRDPMDFNKPGKITSTHYLPDLHVYVDTSGSISEENYQQAVLMLITMAKKLNINLYFNSFSHVLSPEVMLRTKDKSVTQIWKEFQRITKVSGGTEYEQIWRYINISRVRRERLSLVVSDFEWRARSHRVEHPKNLYYAPCGNMDWDQLTYHAEEFMKSAQHLEPAIAQRLIGMVA